VIEHVVRAQRPGERFAREEQPAGWFADLASGAPVVAGGVAAMAAPRFAGDVAGAKGLR
jgi:hypothetical protein